MIIFRRLPGICYNHVYAVSCALGFSVFLIFLLLYWGFLCSNLEPLRHVNNLCRSYEEGSITGDMCESLCSPDGPVHSYSCRAFHAGKEAVFAAMWTNSSHQYRIVVKSAASSDWSSQLDWTDAPYPLENDFRMIIRHTLSSRLNVTLTPEEVESLSKFPSGKSSEEGTESRRKEMVHIWRLLQDNEYLLCRTFEKTDVFPKAVGTCGHYFFTEYLEPVLDSRLSQFIGQDGSVMSWESRLKFGSMLIDLVDSLDSLGLLICDVKPGHFGLTADGDKIKLLDMDATFPKATADKIASDGRICITDEDCAIFDCTSKCDDSYTCRHPVASTNIQVMCWKVFLGLNGSSSSSSFIHLGGLLLGERTPPYLASMLRQCAEGNVKTPELSAAISTTLRHLSPNKHDSFYPDY